MEAVWNTLVAVILFVCWYYPIGFVDNTTGGDVVERGLLVFLLLWMFMIMASTFSHFAITWMPNAEVGGVLVNLFWLLSLACCG